MSDSKATGPESQQLFSDDPSINAFLSKVVTEVRGFTESQVAHIHELVKIGLALSAEKNLDRLLEMIVSEARRFTNADGGTLYIKKDLEDVLAFSIVQNETLKVRMGGTGEKISWPAVPLVNEDGSKNEQNVSAYCAISGTAVNIDDVYDAEGFDFQGTKDFDQTTGYRSKSMLVIPLRDHEDEVIGVLQLLNAREKMSGDVVVFPAHEVEIITSLASTAAIAITNVRLIQGLEDLLHSFVKSIASAIDEKSPYTAGHILRVAGLTESMVDALNRAGDGPFGSVSFTADEVAEIRLAAWMHDVGKISTPEHVVDKSTKLETIFDRVELMRHKLEILKRDAEIVSLKKHLEDGGLQSDSGLTDELASLDDDLGFIEKVNIGGEFLDDDSVARILELGSKSYCIKGEQRPLLTEDEIENLTIRKGTLTESERNVINNHVTVTIKMLESLPFPKKLNKVPLFAGMHHEKLDGTGYPRGLGEDDIILTGRILAVADVFEALTAADRPYKEGKKLSEAIRILGFMVKDKHLDEELCDFVVQQGLISEYAQAFLGENQIDDFEWKGELYSVNGG